MMHAQVLRQSGIERFCDLQLTEILHDTHLALRIDIHILLHGGRQRRHGTSKTLEGLRCCLHRLTMSGPTCLAFMVELRLLDSCRASPGRVSNLRGSRDDAGSIDGRDQERPSAYSAFARVSDDGPGVSAGGRRGAEAASPPCLYYDVSSRRAL